MLFDTIRIALFSVYIYCSKFFKAILKMALLKKTLKLIQTVLACISLASKVGAIDYELYRGNRHSVIGYFLSITYYGYCYLIAILTGSSFKGADLEGILLKYYCILGGVLYIIGEFVLWTDNWHVMAALGVIASFVLAVILILEGIGIL